MHVKTDATDDRRPACRRRTLPVRRGGRRPLCPRSRHDAAATAALTLSLSLSQAETLLDGKGGTGPARAAECRPPARITRTHAASSRTTGGDDDDDDEDDDEDGDEEPGCAAPRDRSLD
jgi:hypothetical protein